MDQKVLQFTFEYLVQANMPPSWQTWPHPGKRAPIPANVPCPGKRASIPANVAPSRERGPVKQLVINKMLELITNLSIFVDL